MTLSTRKKIVASAERLMLRQGLNLTTIEDICRESGMSKGALFHYFKSKEEIAKEVLQSYWSDTLQSLREFSGDESDSAYDSLFKTLDFFESILLSKERTSACLIGNLAQEVSLTNDEIRATCHKIFSDWLGSLTELITRVSIERHVSTDSKAVAELIVSTVEGAFILLKSSGDFEQPRRITSQLKACLQLLFNERS
jgi:TetR/AcrR family transcriptional repressor of nem operon